MLKAFDILLSFVTISWGMFSGDVAVVAIGLVFLTLAAVMDQHISVHMNRWLFRTFFVRRIAASQIGVIAPANESAVVLEVAGNRASRRAAEAQARARRLKAA